MLEDPNTLGDIRKYLQLTLHVHYCSDFKESMATNPYKAILIPVTFIIPGILDFCSFDFGSGCNVVSDGVFSFFFFLPFLVSLAMIVYSNRIEGKSLKKWAKISAVLTFMYAAAMEFLMLIALQTI